MKIKSQINEFTHKDAEIKRVKTLYQGFFRINEYQLRHALFQGGQSKLINREIFERGNAVAVMPYDPSLDAIVLVEQFRVGAINGDQSPWLLELIAGMFDKDELPAQVAIREAKEEANLIIEEQLLMPIMQYFSSPGGTSEIIHLYVAKVIAPECGGICGLADEDEDIKVHVIKLAEALEMIEEGKINNAATIIGVQWLALNKQKLLAS